MAYEDQNKNQILKLLGNNEDKMKTKIFLFYFIYLRERGKKRVCMCVHA